MAVNDIKVFKTNGSGSYDEGILGKADVERILTGEISTHTHVNNNTRVINTFTCIAGQTTFTTSISYSVGNIDVYMNGVKLSVSDFTASNGVSVILSAPAKLGAIVEIVIGNTTAQQVIDINTALAFSLVF